MLSADAKAGLTHLTSWALKLGIRALTGTALTDAPAIADLSVCGHAWSRVQGTVTCTARVVGVAFTHATLAYTISCN